MSIILGNCIFHQQSPSWERSCLDTVLWVCCVLESCNGHCWCFWTTWHVLHVCWSLMHSEVTTLIKHKEGSASVRDVPDVQDVRNLTKIYCTPKSKELLFSSLKIRLVYFKLESFPLTTDLFLTENSLMTELLAMSGSAPSSLMCIGVLGELKYCPISCQLQKNKDCLLAFFQTPRLCRDWTKSLMVEEGKMWGTVSRRCSGDKGSCSQMLSLLLLFELLLDCPFM